MSGSAASGIPLFPVYWERQESALCGTHCLNNLLQGPYFSEIGMSEIAQGIDQRERALMMENGADSSEFLSFMAQDSSNVDESGNFSIEVLAECLQNFSLECVNLASPQCAHIRTNPLDQDGFICNLQSHWLALRKIDGHWFNLNSLQKDNDGWGPTYVSDFYLDTFIAQLQSKKYSIFVVTGSFPPTDTAQDLQGRGRWFSSLQIIDYTKNSWKLPKKPKKNTTNLGAGVDRELQRALAASLEEPAEMGGSVFWDPIAAAAEAAKTAAMTRPVPNNAHAFGGSGDEDEDLRRALALSMADVPASAPAASSSTTNTAPSTTPAAAAAAVSPSPSPAIAAAASVSVSAPSIGAQSSQNDETPIGLPLADDEEMDEEEEMRRAIELSMQQTDNVEQ